MSPPEVEAGAVATLASDNFNDGVITGELVVRILMGEDPGTITPITPTKYNVYANLDAAEKMGVTIPQSVLDRAVEIYE
jgi:putative ABC transport system substrate-binding protein